MARTTIQMIIGENNEFLNTTFNEAFNTYKTILNVSNPIIDKYKEYVIYRIKTKLKPIKNFQSLYDLETSRDMFIEIVVDNLTGLLSSSVVDSLISNENWLEFDTLGSTKMIIAKEYQNTGETSSTSSGNSQIGYQGYNIANQDGSFGKNSDEARGSGTHSSNMSGNESNIKQGEKRLEYLDFLKNYVNSKAQNFINQIKKEMIQLIY